jgi:hypothetical protein
MEGVEWRGVGLEWSLKIPCRRVLERKTGANPCA